jgi:hypothetical protein
MKHALIISLCFLPLAVIYIVMKLSLWMSSSVAEVKYVKEEEKKPHGPFLTNVYDDFDPENEPDDYW